MASPKPVSVGCCRSRSTCSRSRLCSSSSSRPNRSVDVQGLGSAVGITASYGTLVVLAIEGAGFLWSIPDAAPDGYAGETVLAVSLVVAAFAYVVYLWAVESIDWPQENLQRNT